MSNQSLINSPKMALYFIATLLLLWAYSFFAVGIDIHQGSVYRILYIHVPAAFTAFLSAASLCLFSILTLKSSNIRFFHLARASAEVGLLFTIVTILTGSIWGKPTWGTWWSWDARLTTTFILALLYCSYFILASSIDSLSIKKKVCSVLGILIAADVPIIYKSVTWWRTLHQPPSMLSSSGQNMSPEIMQALIANVILVIFIGCWLAHQRAENYALEEKVQAELLG